MRQNSEPIITIQRSYGEPSPPPTPEQQAELERLFALAKQRHPRGKFFIARHTPSGLAIWVDGERVEL
ncbi:hypothetical protein [Meiothermus sp.]|uniref:hypothetical protein n=1 Tax=Meiothermus sp. TaxID=1955249 RepID=UPI002625353A|nr:hypothetical protein [Meiothermus sp.]